MISRKYLARGLILVLLSALFFCVAHVEADSPDPTTIHNAEEAADYLTRKFEYMGLGEHTFTPESIAQAQSGLLPGTVDTTYIIVKDTEGNSFMLFAGKPEAINPDLPGYLSSNPENGYSGERDPMGAGNLLDETWHVIQESHGGSTDNRDPASDWNWTVVPVKEGTPTPPPSPTPRVHTETPVTAVPSATPNPTKDKTAIITTTATITTTTATTTTVTTTLTPETPTTVTVTTTPGTPISPTQEVTGTPESEKDTVPPVYKVDDNFTVELWPPYPLVIGQDYKGDQWIRRGVDYRITIRVPAWMPAIKDNCPNCAAKMEQGACKAGWLYEPDKAIVHPDPGPDGAYVRYRRITSLHIEADLRPESIAWINGELARKYPGAHVYQAQYVLADWSGDGLQVGMRLGPQHNLVVERVRDVAENGKYYTEIVLRQGPGPEPNNLVGAATWSNDRHDPNHPTSIQFRDPGNYDFHIALKVQVPQSASCPEPQLPGGRAKSGERCWTRVGPNDPSNPYFGPCEKMHDPVVYDYQLPKPIPVYFKDITLVSDW